MNLLLIIHIFITVILIGAILIQRSEGGGLGLGTGGGGGLFTARGSANILTRITAVLATLFIGNCLLMTVISSYQLHQENKIIGTSSPQPAQ